MATARLFNLGNSQAVRIPARYRMKAREVEIFERDGDLVLRPKAETAADLFARARLAGSAEAWADMKRPDQGLTRPVPSFD
ncbi:MAG: antitoxin [Panacagrimonas sp.]